MASLDDLRAHGVSPRNGGPRPSTLLLGGLAAALIIGAIVWGVLEVRSCSPEVEAALAELRPQENGDLTVTSHGEGCTRRVHTSRSGAETVAYYGSELRAHGWRVRVRPDEYFRGQCGTGGAQCHGLEAFRTNVCFVLTTNTVRRQQALSAERTQLFFFVARCRGLLDLEKNFS